MLANSVPAVNHCSKQRWGKETMTTGRNNQVAVLGGWNNTYGGCQRNNGLDRDPKKREYNSSNCCLSEEATNQQQQQQEQCSLKKQRVSSACDYHTTTNGTTTTQLLHGSAMIATNHRVMNNERTIGELRRMDQEEFQYFMSCSS